MGHDEEQAKQAFWRKLLKYQDLSKKQQQNCLGKTSLNFKSFADDKDIEKKCTDISDLALANKLHERMELKAQNI